MVPCKKSKNCSNFAPLRAPCFCPPPSKAIVGWQASWKLDFNNAVKKMESFFRICSLEPHNLFIIYSLPFSGFGPPLQIPNNTVHHPSTSIIYSTDSFTIFRCFHFPLLLPIIISLLMLQALKVDTLYT